MSTEQEPTVSTELTYIEASVLCDALSSIEQEIGRGRAPWSEYDGDEADLGDPRSERGYRAALASARAKAIQVIETPAK